MKAIMLMFDSLNRKMLEPYGCDWTITPNFKRLAEKAVTFDNCYAGSLPCMPARRELHTGRLNFLHRAWGPLEPFDDSMPDLLKNNNVYTHLISDHTHYWEDGGCTYHTRYSSWENIRGQEGDPWKGCVTDPEIPPHYGRVWRQDLINRTYLDNETKQPQTLCMDLGLEFLEKNKEADRWFVQIETFDPHEPFYTMEQYKQLYPHNYDGPLFDWPDYRKVSEPASAVEHVRYEYAALLSMCDANLGRLLDYMDDNQMWDDTMLIVNTDHGFLLGEHDCWAKCVHPFYDENAHIPLFVWDPRTAQQGIHRDALVQTIDLAPTLLDFFGVDIPDDMQGKALKPVIESNTKLHDAVLFGMHGGQINVTDSRYVYMRDYTDKNMPLYNYTLMPTHMREMFTVPELRTMEAVEPFAFTKGCRLMRTEFCMDAKSDIVAKEKHGTKLFDLQADPTQSHPINDDDIEAQMIGHMINLMKENDAPPEQYVRMDLQRYL